MVAAHDAVRMTRTIELHRRKLLVAALADTVDQRRGAHALLLGAKVFVELQELGVDLGGDRGAFGRPLLELGDDGGELLCGGARHLLDRGAELLGRVPRSGGAR